MNKFIKLVAVVPVALAVAPVVFNAEEVIAAETLSTFDLHNDVRVVTFSQPIDPASLGSITLFDEKTNESVRIVAEIGNNPKQVKISLAVNEQYEDGHLYKLTLKGIKSATKQKQMAEKVLNYKMVEKAPEEVKFAASYVVTNTTNSAQTYQLPAGASYVIYDEFGVHDGLHSNAVNLLKPETVSLRAKERMTVSFLTNETLQAKEGFTISTATQPSHTVYKLNKSSSIKINSLDEQLKTNIYFGNPSNASTASFTEYNEKGEVVNFDHKVATASGFAYDHITSKNNIVITNEDYAPLYVWAPKTVYELTTVEQTDEDAVSAHQLKRYEIVQVNSTEPTYNTNLDYFVAEGSWRISAVSYKENDVMGTLYREQANLPVHSKGDTLIKNEVGVPLTVSGPGRYVTFTETTEEPLEIKTLVPSEKIKVSSTLVDEQYNTFLYSTEESGITFSNIHTFDDKIEVAPLNKVLTDRFGFVVGNKHANIIENTSEQDVMFYAAKRTTIIEPYTNQLFTTYELAPNKEIIVKSTKETKLFIKDNTRTGTLQMVRNGENKNIQFEYEDTLPIRFDTNETVTLKNTSSVPLTLYTRYGDVSYTIK